MEKPRGEERVGGREDCEGGVQVYGFTERNLSIVPSLESFEEGS